MKQIPEILKGTEAVPFLEWWNRDYGQTELDEIEAHKFLSQSFTSEMITEYFEGWKMRRIWRLLEYTNKHYMIDYYENSNELIFTGTSLSIQTHLPQTINDFISDCHRAGIKLKYK